MTLRIKTLLILCVAMGGLMLALHVIASRIMLDSFADLEERHVVQNASRARDALLNEVNTLHMKAGDWAVWDDTYRFVADGNAEYVTANLGDETFVNLQLSVILMADATGGLVFGKCVDLRTGQPMPVPDDLLRRFAPGSPLLSHKDPQDHHTGVLQVGNATYMVSARPILQNSGEGPARGTLVFGRLMDDALIAHLSEITHLDLRFVPASQEDLCEHRPATVNAMNASLAPVAQVLSPTMISAHFLVPDVFDQPVLLGCVEQRREIFARGQITIGYYLAALLMIGAGVAFVSCVLLNRTVLAPVSRLRDGVRRIGESGDLATQVQANGRDEIADLAREFNRMIQTLAATQRELTDARDQARAATQAKSEFLANMSHEIRTPMTAILGYADLLQDASQSPTERAECTQIIRRNGQHLLEIINDILDMSRIEAGKLTVDPIDCSLQSVVTDVITLLRARAADKGLTLSVEYVDHVPEQVRTDPTRLRQILLNLVSNAIKFTQHGSVRIVIHARNLADARVEAGGARTQLTFAVADTGIGMTAEQISRLFQPFSQADNSTTRRFGGTGLGLHICKQLAALLGGDIHVQSDPGHGSTFTLTITTDAARAAKPTDSPLPSDGAMPATERPLAGRSILLAEDGPDNQRLIAFLLRRAGAHVTIVGDGRQAIDAALNPRSVDASNSAVAFDAILMDMQMPDIDGYTAAATLRKHGYTGRIVALTAHAMSGDRERCIEAGCDDYATKPIAAAALIRAIVGESSTLTGRRSAQAA